LSEEGKSDKPQQEKRKTNSEFLLFVIFVVFVVVAVGGMMALNAYGEKRMGDASKIHDAADK
jgi:flagellar basal body-associated protein FliL